MVSINPPIRHPTPRRGAATTQVTADLAIGELCNEISPIKDPSRWSPFVAAPKNATGLVAVVAPHPLAGRMRFTGRISRAQNGRGLHIETARRLRYGGLRVDHEVRLIPAGTFRTVVEVTTTFGGPARAVISRRRITAWHRAEIEALTTRAERGHFLHPATHKAHADPTILHTELDHRSRVSASASGRNTQA